MSQPTALPAPAAHADHVEPSPDEQSSGPQVEHSVPGLLLRPGREGDLPLVYHSWLHTLREADPWGEISRTAYFRGQHAVIEGLLSRSQLVVAALEDDQDQILGYAVAAPPVLHWLYVKSLFRHYGVARALLEHLGIAAPVTYSHRTKWCRRLFPDGVYDPFKAWLP